MAAPPHHLLPPPPLHTSLLHSLRPLPLPARVVAEATRGGRFTGAAMGIKFAQPEDPVSYFAISAHRSMNGKTLGGQELCVDLQRSKGRAERTAVDDFALGEAVVPMPLIHPSMIMAAGSNQILPMLQPPFRSPPSSCTAWGNHPRGSSSASVCAARPRPR